MNILKLQGLVAKLVPGRGDNTQWLGSVSPADVSFIAQTASHVGEAVAASSYLEENGISARIFLPNPPQGVTRTLRRSFHRAIEAQSQMASEGLKDVAQLVSVENIVATSSKIIVFNVWGMPRDMVLEANRLGVETFGWVEGFQDFTNADLKRKDLPYRRVQRVLGLVGSEKQFFESSQFLLVGSPRLANIERGQIPHVGRTLDVLVNLNFSYGVSRRYSRDWAAKVAHACELVSREASFTRHPLDKPGWGYRHESIGPLASVICNARTLVTRSGTALLEGLAAGCDVIFFNPNREKAAQYLVDEFPGIQEVNTESELIMALGENDPKCAELPAVSNFSEPDPLKLLLAAIVNKH